MNSDRFLPFLGVCLMTTFLAAASAGHADVIAERQKKRAQEVAASGRGWAAHHCSLFLGTNIAAANDYFAKNAPGNATGSWRWGVTGLLRTYFQFGDTHLSGEAKKSILAVCRKARDDNPWSANGSNPQNWPWGNSENKRLTSLAVHVLVDQAVGPGPRHAAAQAAAKEELVTILREGSSEYNSPHYSSHSLRPALLLAEFCADPAIKELARMVVDQYLADIALESVRGVRGGPYFRGYDREITDNANDSAVREFSYFFFGNGRDATDMTSEHWITTTYRPPQVVLDLGTRPEEKGAYVQSGRSRFGREGLQSFYFYMQPGFSLASMQNRVKHVDDATPPSHANQVWEFTTDDPKKILGAYKKIMKNPDSPHTANMQHKNVLFFAGDFLDYNKNLGHHETEKRGDKALHFYRVATWAGDAYVGITHYPGASGGILEVRPGKDFATWDAFKEAIRKAPSSCADWGKRTTYTSTAGEVISYNNGEATVNGAVFPVKDYPRYNGTFMDSAWGGGVTRIAFGGKSVTLDYRDPEKPVRREENGAASAPAGALELDGTFESGSPGQLSPVGKRYYENSWLGFAHAEVNPGNSIRIIESPVREGKRAARFEVKRPGIAADWRRAEVVERYPFEMPEGKRERWYGGSFLLPDDYEWDDQPVIIFQIHEHGSEVKHPIFTLNIKANKLGDLTLKKNTWYDFALHARWSNEADGFVEHWINGEKKSEKRNVKTSALTDNRPPYAKWGIYKYAWRSDPKGSTASKVVVIWDNCKIGASREDVIPPPLKTP